MLSGNVNPAGELMSNTSRFSWYPISKDPASIPKCRDARATLAAPAKRSNTSYSGKGSANSSQLTNSTIVMSTCKHTQRKNLKLGEVGKACIAYHSWIAKSFCIQFIIPVGNKIPTLEVRYDSHILFQVWTWDCWVLRFYFYHFF